MNRKPLVKTPTEIASIEKACQLGDFTFLYILKQLREGISEKTLAKLIKQFIKDGGSAISFRPIVAFNENALTIHHQPGDRKLNHPSLVLLDFGAKVDDYCSDMTRTVFFGKANRRQRMIYKTVLKAQQKAIDYISQTKNPSGFDVDTVAREFIIQRGFPSMPHSLGHGIGTKVHERPSISPKSKNILTPGMVFTIEPGIYLEDFGGVRIEDTFVLEREGLRPLTKSPKHLIEI